MTGDVTTRNKMLKLIPHIDSGNWVVRQAVGTKPVITGKVGQGGGTLHKYYLHSETRVLFDLSHVPRLGPQDHLPHNKPIHRD